MNRFDDLMKHLAADQSVPDRVKAKFTQTLQDLPEHEASPRKKWNPVLQRVAAFAASLFLVAGSVYAMERGGLFEYLSKVIGTSAVQTEIQEVTETDVSSSFEDAESMYGPLWNITDSWYDGAKIYFEAIVPEEITENRKLEVSPSDHCVVNGQDTLLNFDIPESGRYICNIDTSKFEGVSTLEVQVKLKLLRNQYNWDEYILTTDPDCPYDYSKDVTLEEEQTLSFVISGESVVRSGKRGSISIENGYVTIKQALLSPSTLHLEFTYHLSGDSAEEMLEIPGVRSGLFYIEDVDGHRISYRGLSVGISDIYTDVEGYLCRDYEIDGSPFGKGETEKDPDVQLSADTQTLKIIACDGEWDEEGKHIPGRDVELGWGSFTISFVEES